MKVNLLKTAKDGHISVMLLPVILIDWSRNYKAVTFGWLVWLFSIYKSKGGQL